MMNLLTVNVGSSSLRLALYRGGNGGTELALLHTVRCDLSTRQAVDCLDDFLHRHGPEPPTAVAHRVVHGGAGFTRPGIIDKRVEADIDRLSSLAPLHNPPALAMIRACRRRLGDATPQIAVFDTSFFAELPAVAAHYALPRDLSEKHGIRRFGFHGLAHQAMWESWWALRPDLDRGGRIITLQLGAGCSIAAIKNGKPVDTSMGFSPLEGLVMATRCGDLDPGLLLYLQQCESLAPQQLGALLNERSGLLGLSGVSGDIGELMHSKKADAQFAVDCYVYRLRKYIGAYLAVLDGADAILFGGGVGENLPELRRAVLAPLRWQGIALDATANAGATGRQAVISEQSSRIAVAVIPVRESNVIARQAVALLKTEMKAKIK